MIDSCLENLGKIFKLQELSVPLRTVPVDEIAFVS